MIYRTPKSAWFGTNFLQHDCHRRPQKQNSICQFAFLLEACRQRWIGVCTENNNDRILRLKRLNLAYQAIELRFLEQISFQLDEDIR